ncbi:hypothetical protein VPH35_020046 [Triticum aestivum]
MAALEDRGIEVLDFEDLCDGIMICNMSSPEEVRLLLDDTVAGNTAKVAVLLMMEQRLGHFLGRLKPEREEEEDGSRPAAQGRRAAAASAQGAAAQRVFLHHQLTAMAYRALLHPASGAS